MKLNLLKEIKEVKEVKISARNILLCSALIILLSGLWCGAMAQNKTFVQVKTFDRQLNAIPDLQVSLDGEQYFTTDHQGLAFVEVIETHLPPTEVKIKSNNLEAESWNYSRGILEIIIRKKNYQIVTIVVKDQQNKPVRNLAVSFNSPEPVTANTNASGELKMPVPLGEDLNTTDLFFIKGYKIRKKRFIGTRGNFIVTQIKLAQTGANSKPGNKGGLNAYSLQTLDSIRSLTAFYAFIKDLDMQRLDDSTKQKIDLKFYWLVEQKEDSLMLQSSRPMEGKITDSSLVKNDVMFLIDQALNEERYLEDVQLEFEEKIETINQKLTTGGKNLTEIERNRLLGDLEKLEKILAANERKFFRNQSNYHAILGSLKNGLLDIKQLEDQLTFSERQRLKEKEEFHNRLIIILQVIIGLGLLAALSIYLAKKFKKQKNELAVANAEVKRINQHLEELVSQKTESLEKANKELDTFLYKSSHNLKRPLTSIIGLSNIAKLTLDAKSLELFEKTSQTAVDMDKMLQKLMMVSEINHPSGFDKVDFEEKIKKVTKDFEDYIQENKIMFDFKVCRESHFESFPAVVEIILRNLVENALFYSTLKAGDQPKVGVSVSRENGQVNILVHDNGIGIRPDARRKVWDMFYVGDENSRGNGLGLYIAQKAAGTLNGSVSFTTEEDLFTEFKVILPVNNRT